MNTNITMPAAMRSSPIALDDVVSEAALQTRVDRKYLLTADQFNQLISGIGHGFKILEIDNQRSFQYESVYFDTPAFGMYRDHLQGRRRRMKIRTRAYVDTDLCMVEAKFKGLRGATVKERMEYPLQARGYLNAQAQAFLAAQTYEHYGQELPAIMPVMQSNYQRATWVNPASQERLTCDVELVYGKPGAVVRGPQMVVVETKSANGRGIGDQVLAQLGIREESMSKYCLGMALLHPHLPANKWSRLLRNHFSWQRM